LSFDNDWFISIGNDVCSYRLDEADIYSPWLNLKGWFTAVALLETLNCSCIELILPARTWIFVLPSAVLAELQLTQSESSFWSLTRSASYPVFDLTVLLRAELVDEPIGAKIAHLDFKS
jgi:hypothetical protein